MNPSGNDSEMAGPVGIVHQRHFQVPVSALLLQHTLSRCRTLTQHCREAQLCGGIVESIETNSATALSPSIWKDNSKFSKVQPFKLNGTRIQRHNR